MHNTETDLELLILNEVKEVLDVPLECEHETHGNPAYANIHDDEGARWYVQGGHGCGREVDMYICNRMLLAGLMGHFVIHCSKCDEDGIPFTEYYPIRTKISPTR